MFKIERLRKKQVLQSRNKNPGENVMRLRSRQSRIKILTRRWSREPRKHNAAAELLAQFLNMFFMLNIRSKLELSEPHLFTAPALTDVVARCGSIGLQLLDC
jgi:hypothetical protein